MEGDNSLYYKHYEQISNVLLKPSVIESMFISWFATDKQFEDEKLLTYG